MVTFEFEGKQFEADEDVLTDYEFVVGLFGDSDGIVWIALAVLFAGLVAAIAFGVRLMRKVM